MADRTHSVVGASGRRRLRATPFGDLVVAFAIAFNLVLVVVFARFAGDGADRLAGWATLGSAVLVATTAFLLWRERRRRPTWVLVGAALAVDTVARALFWFDGEPLVGAVRPGTVVQLLVYPLLALALVARFPPSSDDQHLSAHLDSLIIGLGAAAVLLALWFDPILQLVGEDLPTVAFARPIGDLVLLVTFAVGLVAYRNVPPRSLPLVVGALLTWTVVDVAGLATEHGRALPGEPLDAGFLLASVLLVAAVRVSADEPRSAAREGSVGFTVVPSVVGILALSILAVSVVTPIAPVALWLSLATLGLVLLRTVRTVRELRDAHLSHVEARTDELTGLTNRRGFNEALDALLGGSVRVTVVALDIDGFKDVNDSLGHPAGDDLLRIVAKRFRRAQPRGATLARLGGDEFALVLQGGDGMEIAAAIARTLDESVVVDGIPARVGASIGVAYSPDHGTDATELLRAADVAMYAAKRRRSGVAAYDPGDDPHTRERLAAVEALHGAIASGDIELVYQPIVDIRGGVVAGVEALARWKHADLGVVEPSEFIGLAEAHGLIAGLTRLVVERSFASLSTLLDLGHDVSMNVNISSYDLDDPDLVDFVRDRLARHRVPARQVTLEITETAIAFDRERATSTAYRLRSAGVGIAIDDFGVGYSSMAQLLDLPVDELKVDREMVNAADDAKVWAVTDLGRALGARVVAEGIESAVLRRLVARAGVDRAQGHFIARPMSFDDLLDFLALPTVRTRTIDPAERLAAASRAIGPAAGDAAADSGDDGPDVADGDPEDLASH